MKIKLVTDSAANVCSNITQDISYVPLKIVTSEKEYVDDNNLNVPKMLADLRVYNGKSGTACPGIMDWLTAFDESDTVFGVALTSGLSGSYNSASIASEEYMQSHPGSNVFILDSLSAGPELELILEKYQELIAQGLDFEQIRDAVIQYHEHTHLLFSLESLDNLAKNGRVSHVVAKALGVLGLRVVGKASDVGTLEPISKCRGEKKALSAILQLMKKMNFNGGKVRITHSYNPIAAQSLQKQILSEYPDSDISISLNRGLCCFYAEEGAVLVAFEDAT